MTTMVKITTHGWPVRIDIEDGHNSRAPKSRSYGHSSTSEFVEKESSREIAVTNSRSIRVTELPADARDLDHAEELMGYGSTVAASLGSLPAPIDAAVPAPAAETA